MKFFLTTSLPYSNNKPHVGHALEFVQASAIKRYLLRNNFPGQSVFLNLGLDEHGSKIFEACGSDMDATRSHCDQMMKDWLAFCLQFEVEYDNFYRTTDPEHARKVSKYWLDLVKKGDIYKANYVGDYCVGCESFKSPGELDNGKCLDHPNMEIRQLSEENYFFRQSKYRDLVKEAVKKEGFLYPDRKLDELLNNIDKSGDKAVSRPKEKLPWGIAVPDDGEHVIYVWWEALCNYIFAKPEAYWNESTTIQLAGPDNLSFQGNLWQAMLLAGGNKPTSHLLIHGTVLDEDGRKMSKSLGNVIDPTEQRSKYGLSAVRWYMLKGFTTFGNAKWSEKELVETYNADLANNLGNLLARVTHLMKMKGVEAPINKSHLHNDISDSSIRAEVTDRIGNYHLAMAAFDIHEALSEAMRLLHFGNLYMTSNRLWEKASPEEGLQSLWLLLRSASRMAAMALSNEDNQRIHDSLHQVNKVIVFPRIDAKFPETRKL